MRMYALCIISFGADAPTPSEDSLACVLGRLDIKISAYKTLWGSNKIMLIVFIPKSVATLGIKWIVEKMKALLLESGYSIGGVVLREANSGVFDKDRSIDSVLYLLLLKRLYTCMEVIERYPEIMKYISGEIKPGLVSKEIIDRLAERCLVYRSEGSKIFLDPIFRYIIVARSNSERIYSFISTLYSERMVAEIQLICEILENDFRVDVAVEIVSSLMNRDPLDVLEKMHMLISTGVLHVNSNGLIRIHRHMLGDESVLGFLKSILLGAIEGLDRFLRADDSCKYSGVTMPEMIIVGESGEVIVSDIMSFIASRYRADVQTCFVASIFSVSLACESGLVMNMDVLDRIVRYCIDTLGSGGQRG